jgi:hypothetical protein
MTRPKSRQSPVSAEQCPLPPFPPPSRTDFYREEFLKHQRCLQEQREYFSERAITNVECALASILARLDQLCCQDNADCVVSALLKQFDAVTRLSAWSDTRKPH